MSFFDDRLLLSSDEAAALYRTVAALPIIDYHSHLDEGEIAADARYDNLGELWLKGDHYK